jgi:putative transposase
MKANNISMDGKGRAPDNVFTERLRRPVINKYVYLNPAADGNELFQGSGEYFDHSNHCQSHQGNGRRIPADLFKPAA